MQTCDSTSSTAKSVPESHKCFCPRCGAPAAHEARADPAGVVTAIVCDECGHEFAVAKPDDEIEP